MELCEVRVPTFNRPALLKRAIRSLLDQDYHHWKAVISDDSLDDESFKIIEGFKDPRLFYQKNVPSKGAAGNLNYCFKTSPLFNGTYAFVLEDDNYLLPNFISQNIYAMQTSHCNVVLRNQWVEIFRNESDCERTSLTTRGMWMKEGIHLPIEIHALLFFMEGVSNGGLFWRTNAVTDFQVSETRDAGLQENYRSLHITEPLFFASEPLAVFSLMEKKQTARNNTTNRQYARGRQAIIQQTLRIHQQKVIAHAERMAETLSIKYQFEKALIDGFYFRYAFTLPPRELFISILKSFARYAFIRPI